MEVDVLNCCVTARKDAGNFVQALRQFGEVGAKALVRRRFVDDPCDQPLAYPPQHCIAGRCKDHGESPSSFLSTRIRLVLGCQYGTQARVGIGEL